MGAVGEAPVGEMVERIVAGFELLGVVLFCSLARGEGTRDSDADLLVVFSEVGRDGERRLMVEIRHAQADVPFPKDVVVTDLEEIERAHGDRHPHLQVLRVRSHARSLAPVQPLRNPL